MAKQFVITDSVELSEKVCKGCKGALTENFYIKKYGCKTLESVSEMWVVSLSVIKFSMNIILNKETNRYRYGHNQLF